MEWLEIKDDRSACEIDVRKKSGNNKAVNKS